MVGTMLGKGAGIREDEDDDVLKHQLNSAVLGTREEHCSRELHFQDNSLLTCVHAAVRRDGHSFIPTTVGHSYSLSWSSIIAFMVRTSSGGNSSLPFASLDRSLVWLTLRLGERDAAVLRGTAFSLAACASCGFKAVFLVWHCQSGRCIRPP